MDSNKTVTAHFSEIPTTYYTLTANVAPDDAGNVILDPSGGTYEEGTVVNLTAYANSGYVFDHWSGNASGSNPTIQITMDSNKTVTAHFSEIPPTAVINITRPESYYIYFNDKKVFPTLFKTWILGPITIEVNVTGDVDHVAFLINDEVKSVDYSQPFKYTWNERAIGRRTISVKAYDYFDNLLAEDHINVTVINLKKATKNETEYAVLYGTVYDYNKIINKKIPWAKIEVYKWNNGEWKKIDKERTGRFLFRKGDYKLKLEPGYYKINATARNYDYETRYVYLAKGDSKLMDFYLNQTVILRGKIKNGGLFGVGIRGANITAIRQSDGKVFNAKSRLFGRYILPLPPGNYTIRITADGYKLTEKSIDVHYKLVGNKIKRNFILEKEA